MKKIFIRADGGKGIGLGHIMRMLVLAKELGKKYDITFLCIKNNSDRYLPGINKIKESGFKIIELTSNRYEEILDIQKEMQASFLITDSYNVDSNYFDEMRKVFPKTAYMYDIDVCDINVDLIINQNINANELLYDRIINKETKFLLGTKYVLLRDEFRVNIPNINKNNVKDILLTLGGTDDKYLSLKIIETLKELDCNLHVIIGNAFEEELINEINNFKTDKLRVITYKNAIMSEVMAKCDMAISACGTTLYELAAMNIPTIGIVIANNQEEIARVMDRKKIIVNTRNLINEDKEKFKLIFYDVLESKEIRDNLIKNGNENVDRDGVINIVKEIALLLE